MAITKTTQVARKIMNKGKGTYLFNDRLVDGRRSLKVWGWSDAEYRKAKRELEAQGCKVDMVQFVAHKWNMSKLQTRLHVEE